MRPGVYTVTVELSGFAKVNRENLELLVGQRATLDFRLELSATQETITVTATAALVDLTQSKLGGNVDRRQMEELPLNGRNFLGLVMLAKGSRANAVSDSPGVASAVSGLNNPGNFQINLDGQQVTSTIAQDFYGEPKFSRDAIGEFELITSRFDATQGRSSGIQLNAVTKSGTNTFTGTGSGYFRDDTFNAKDFVVNRVLPYSNQMFSATFGGPITRDRAHFFVAYEGEREPGTVSYISAYPHFNIPDRTAIRRENKASSRLDAQFSPVQRLMVRAAGWTFNNPRQSGGGSSSNPNRDRVLEQQNYQVLATWNSVIGSRKMNELAVGVSHHEWLSRARTLMGGPAIELQGYSFGLGSNGTIGGCCLLNQTVPSISERFTYINGDHTMRMGGEFLYPHGRTVYDGNRIGTLDARGGAVPSNIADILPSNDPSTWNLAALSPITRSFQVWIGDYDQHNALPVVSAWLQDDWKATSRLTVNLGLRYDLFYNGMAQDVELLPLRRKGVPQDWWNFGPRVGFAYALHEGRTVIRGGTGKYFASPRDQEVFHTRANIQTVPVLIQNDGRPNFAADPFNILGGGRVPTHEEATAGSNRATHSALTADNSHNEYSYQSSIGFQRGIGRDISVEADYVWVAQRNVENSRESALTYNPETGANYPWTDRTRRVFTNWSSVNYRFFDARSDYHALEAAITKRFSQHWQLSASYTLAGEWVFSPGPLLPGCQYPATAPGPVCDVPITLAPDLAEDYFLSGAQRHRVSINGVWELPHDFQLSGLYFYGDNGKVTTTPGIDVRLKNNTTGRLRPDGTLIPRNNFDLPSLHRVDMRFQRRFRFAGQMSLTGMFEVFNLFNHANYGGFITNEASASFGQPQQNPNVSYQPRMLQLGFRLAF
jgi:hypothetical protein